MPTFGQRLRGLLQRTPTIAVHVLVKGRIGPGWFDVDRTVKLPARTTLGSFIDGGDRWGLPLRAALEASPHLTHTLMWNGERAPVATHRDRPLADGDQLYLLAPLAGG